MNGDTSIRPCLTGTSSGTRDAAWPSSSPTRTPPPARRELGMRLSEAATWHPCPALPGRAAGRSTVAVGAACGQKPAYLGYLISWPFRL